MEFRPELLSPAGSLDKLKASVLYGADAVYLAGQKYGLRSAAENFTLEELEEGVEFAHARKAKTYVVLNAFPHDRDLDGMAEFVRDIERIGVDGVIASDLGVITIVDRETKLPIHLSTQASCLNEASAKMWKRMNVKRLILGREVSIREAGEIKRATGLEVELFIHGSMCMAYSGNCTISNFTKGRDSNRGGCAQSCRFSYSLEFEKNTGEKETRNNSYFMSSKDLLGLDLLGEFFREEIDSVKIEGRMRSPLYAGTISKIYREAIDAYSSRREFTSQELMQWHQELERIPHREYMSGSLAAPADRDSVLDARHFADEEHYDFLGLIRKVTPEYVLLETMGPFREGETIEWVPFTGASRMVTVQGLRSALGAPTDQAKSSSLVRLPRFEGAEPGQFMRKLKLSVAARAGAQS